MQTLKLTKKYETYPEYKDSGVEWLGKIPKDWENRKVKEFFKINRGRVISREEMDDIYTYPVYSSQTENDGCMGYINSYDFDKEALTWTTDGAKAGSLFHRKGKFNTTNVCGVLTPKNELSFIYFLNSIQLSANHSKRPDTNGYKIMSNEMKNMPVIVPDFSTQKTIAKYLGEKISFIDQIINKKHDVIELLLEKRMNLINRTVTKGLDPKAELVESGIGWIGKIPKNWQMRKLFHLFKTIGSGTTPDERYLTDSENGVPWVNTGDLKDSYIELPSKKVKPEALQECSALKLFSKDAVVIAMYGATIGKLGIPRFDFCTNQACCVLEGPSKFISEKFVYFWLLGNKKYIIEMGVGGGQPNINKDIVKSLKVSLPPKSIQDEIVEYLDKKISSYDKAIKCVEQSIEKLKEFKSALISNVVTGKIKV